MTHPVDFTAASGRSLPGATAATTAPWSRWVTFGAMLALALVCYLPAGLRAEFLAFDDNFYFGAQNEVFRSGFGALFAPSRPIANAWLPVSHASLWLDWSWFGANPMGAHLHSLLLHALVGFVFVRLLVRLDVPSLAAHLAGAIYVVHPALAESVAWVSGRKDLLAGLFVMLALHQLLAFDRRGGGWRVLLVLLCSALAMYAKATAVVLPGLALLVCLMTRERRARFVVVGLVAIVCALIAWHHQSIAIGEGPMLAGDAADRWNQVPGAYLHYLRSALWPTDLNVLYPEVQTLERFREVFLPALVVITALATGALMLLGTRRLRVIGGGLCFFLIALLPFNTAFPASSIAAADRYLHLAIPGLALAVALAASRAFGRVGIAVVALALVPLAFLSGSRAHDFARTESLWRASLEVDDDNAVAHFNLATELMTRQPLPLEELQQHLDAAVRAARYPVHALRARRVLQVLALQSGDYERAAAHARAAITAARAQLDREIAAGRREQAEELLVKAHLEAFESLRLSGDEDGAQASYEAAVAAVSDHPEVLAFGSLLDLAVIGKELVAEVRAGGDGLLDADDPRGLEADRLLDAALEEHPDHPALLFAKASWLRVRGDRLLALGFYQRAQQADPMRVDPWLGAARMMREQGLYPDAVKYAQGGLRYRQDPALRQEWAMSLVGLGQLTDAVGMLEAYMQERPLDRDTGKVLANLLVGQALARLSDGAEAHEAALRLVERARAHDPNEVKGCVVVGRIAHERRRFAFAVENFEKAHRAMPQLGDVQRQLTESLRCLGTDRLLKKDERGAGDAWLRCLEVAPEGTDLAGVRDRIANLWRRHKAAGIAHLDAGESTAAIAEFRRCQQLDPDQHLSSWLLAMAMRDRPDVDLVELERLCREAIAWEEKQGRDTGLQVYLLLHTLVRLERGEEARRFAASWLEGEHPDTEAQVRAAIETFARR